jgi:hypothetical protein
MELSRRFPTLRQSGSGVAETSELRIITLF